jgi:hypothetical protein
MQAAQNDDMQAAQNVTPSEASRAARAAPRGTRLHPDAVHVVGVVDVVLALGRFFFQRGEGPISQERRARSGVRAAGVRGFL